MRVARNVIPLLCSIFLANQGAGDTAGEGNVVSWNDEAAVFTRRERSKKDDCRSLFSTGTLHSYQLKSRGRRDSIADCLPNRNLVYLVPVLERFVAFHLTLNMISPENS
ncbi:hypothetical protein NC652_037252 [Populus alba x Populus x berolinensis]|nr:hypothetical protein NC652_037252 [Populus alba x Populus x berolinensis]